MNTISYKIASMQIPKSVVVPKLYKENGSIQINNSFSFGVDLKKCLLLCKHKLILGKCNEVFAEFILETVFAITQNSLKEMEKDDKLTIPAGFLIQCGSISYGSLRGIVLQETKRNGLDNIIIPPLYIDTIIKKPMIVDLNK